MFNYCECSRCDTCRFWFNLRKNLTCPRCAKSAVPTKETFDKILAELRRSYGTDRPRKINHYSKPVGKTDD